MPKIPKKRVAKPPKNPSRWPRGCPRPEEEILLSNNKWIQAGDLQIGDQVVTSKEIQTVTRVDRLEEQERCEVFFEGLEGEESNSIVTSYSHPYYVEGKGFTEVSDLKIGDIIGSLIVKAKKAFDLGPVISLSVDIAETYMLRAGTENNPMPALSHNKTPKRPPPKKKPPMPKESRVRKRPGMSKGGAVKSLTEDARSKALEKVDGNVRGYYTGGRIADNQQYQPNQPNQPNQQIAGIQQAQQLQGSAPAGPKGGPIIQGGVAPPIQIAQHPRPMPQESRISGRPPGMSKGGRVKKKK